MKWPIRIVTVILISCSIAFLLSWIPELQTSKKAGMSRFDFSVFRHEKEAILNDQNIVDSLLRLPMGLKIAKVDITQTMLSIDLLMKDPLKEEPLLFMDLYDIVQFSFRGSNNIGQVFVRVMLRTASPEGQKKDVLLVAMDARKEDMESELKADTTRIQSAEQYILSHFKITKTNKWHEVLKH